MVLHAALGPWPVQIDFGAKSAEIQEAQWRTADQVRSPRGSPVLQIVARAHPRKRIEANHNARSGIRAVGIGRRIRILLAQDCKSSLLYGSLCWRIAEPINFIMQINS
jgi:hypothetical protein